MTTATEEKIRTKPFPMWPMYGEEEIELIAEILRSGHTHPYNNNDIIQRYEKRFAEWNTNKYAIACNSGTSALHMALAALGVGPGDEVIVPPRTFIGSISPVLYQNAVPVFADIDPDTHNIDPDSIEKVITERTKAILPVHLAGIPCDMERIMQIAEKHDLYVVEDCAQAHGAEIKGKKVGTFGHVNAFSMQDSKIITTAGDGGMLVSDDEALADYCQEFRNHGFSNKRKHGDLHIYVHPRVGNNYRLTHIQAAVGLKAMDRVDDYIRQRRENSHFLNGEISKIPGLKAMAEPESCFCSYYVYYVTMDLDRFSVDRDELVRELLDNNIASRIGTAAELYDQDIFRQKLSLSWDPRLYDGSVNYEGIICPVAHKVGKETFGLEVGPPATVDDMKDTVRALNMIAAKYGK